MSSPYICTYLSLRINDGKSRSRFLSETQDFRSGLGREKAALRPLYCSYDWRVQRGGANSLSMVSRQVELRAVPAGLVKSTPPKALAAPLRACATRSNCRSPPFTFLLSRRRTARAQSRHEKG